MANNIPGFALNNGQIQGILDFGQIQAIQHNAPQDDDDEDSADEQLDDVMDYIFDDDEPLPNGVFDRDVPEEELAEDPGDPDDSDSSDSESSNSDDSDDTDHPHGGPDRAQNGPLPGDGWRFADPRLHDPFELLDIEWEDRWMLNLEHRNLPPGELEYGRTHKARRISWLYDYHRPSGGIDVAYFFNQGERFGGPLGFMSNHHRCDFTVFFDEEDEFGMNHRIPILFNSMEKYYQYCKAQEMAKKPERILYKGDQRFSSHELGPRILQEDNPNMCAKLGRMFNGLEKTDPQWWRQWFRPWFRDIPRVLQVGLDAKFDPNQNRDLAEMLVMTGDFHLAKAAPRDKGCGIGYHASEARRIYLKGRRTDRKYWGQNYLGEALMDKRDALRPELGIPDVRYAWRFYRHWEEACNWQRYKKRGLRGVAMPDPPPRMRDLKRERDRLKQKWFDDGDDDSDSDSDSEPDEDRDCELAEDEALVVDDVGDMDDGSGSDTDTATDNQASEDEEDNQGGADDDDDDDDSSDEEMDQNHYLWGEDVDPFEEDFDDDPIDLDDAERYLDVDENGDMLVDSESENEFAEDGYENVVEEFMAAEGIVVPDVAE